DLPRHELEAPAWALVVEEDARHRVEPEALTIVHGDPMAVDFRDAVGTARVERRRLALWRFDDLAEHLTRAGLIEPRLRRRLLHRLEHPRHAERRELTREHGLRPGCLHEALCGEIVDLLGLIFTDDVGE